MRSTIKPAKKKRFVEVGKRLKNVRSSLKLSQSEMAHALNISNCYLSHIETGIGNPGIEFFTKLIKEYNVNLNYLMSGDGSMFIEKKAGPNKNERDFIDSISEQSDLVWLMENSPIFYNFIMGQGGKFFYDNELILEENVKRTRVNKRKKSR